MGVLYKQKGAAVILARANTTIAFSDVQTTDEPTVVAMDITQISFSVDSSGAAIKRGANTVIDLYGAAEWELPATPITQDAAGNLVINFGGKGTVVLTVRKHYD